jgi:uncharacterized repeat protein (TIGR02543 family)
MMAWMLMAYFADVEAGSYDLYDGDTLLKAGVSIAHGEIGETLKYWTVSFDTNEGGTVLDNQIVFDGQKVKKPVDLTSDGYSFNGWTKTKDSDDYWNFETDNVTANTTLYAKWEAEVADVPVIDPGEDGEVNAGDIVTLGNTGKWRILKVNNGKTLIIKEEALSAKEMSVDGKTGSATTGQEIKFLSETAMGALSPGSSNYRRGNYYFDSDGSNGYEDSGLSQGYGLKSAIDNYYNNYLLSYESSILAVDLDNPKLSTFNTKNSLSWTYSGSGTSWNAFYQDQDFVTSLVDITNNENDFKKQAFALSYGDISSFTLGSSSTFLSFGSSNSFWLRSVGVTCFYTGYVDGGNLNKRIYVYSTLPVRPALWVKLD